VPVGLLLQHRFPSAAFMTGNATPAAVIAAAEDRVVKPHRTKALVARLENLVFEATLQDAGHETLYQLPAYETTLQAAFGALRDAAPGDRSAQGQAPSMLYDRGDEAAAGATGDE
jgi:hypothetical protein